jgi:hypothetical protein
VRAYNTGGNSAYSNTASATTIPAAPANLTATAASLSQIDLSWSDNSGNETGFKIERSIDGTTFAEIASVGANVTTYTDTGLNESTKYYYKVRAHNSGGDSEYSNIASATTAAPAAPSVLTAAPASSSSVDLSWTDNSNDETQFKIERSDDAGISFTQIATVGANVTTYTDTGLTPLTTYTYQVRSSNLVGDSSYSNTASAVILP